MPGLPRCLQCNKPFLILLREPGQDIARGSAHRASRKITALRGVQAKAFERLLFHEVATHLP